MSRQLLRTSNSCTSMFGLCTITVEYGFCSQMAGTPRGMQFTEDFDSSSSVGVIDLILANAAGLKAGGSSGVTFGSNWRIAAGSTPNRPLTPWPALFGSQCPDKSGWPSDSRGAGPPGGITLIVYSWVCASAGAETTDNAEITTAQATTYRITLTLCPLPKT